jgi:hypothetical protein
MAQGLDDERIIDQILTGGDHTMTRTDLERLESLKKDELLKEALREGS